MTLWPWQRLGLVLKIITGICMTCLLPNCGTIISRLLATIAEKRKMWHFWPIFFESENTHKCMTWHFGKILVRGMGDKLVVFDHECRYEIFRIASDHTTVLHCIQTSIHPQSGTVYSSDLSPWHGWQASGLRPRVPSRDLSGPHGFASDWQPLRGRGVCQG